MIRARTGIVVAAVSAVTILVLSHGVAWVLGYRDGHVHSGKLHHKTELTLNMRALRALESNDIEKVRELISLDIWMNAGALRRLGADPNVYVVSCERWRVAPDERYESLLGEAEAVRRNIRRTYTEFMRADGTVFYLPPKEESQCEHQQGWEDVGDQ